MELIVNLIGVFWLTLCYQSQFQNFCVLAQEFQQDNLKSSSSGIMEPEKNNFLASNVQLKPEYRSVQVDEDNFNFRNRASRRTWTKNILNGKQLTDSDSLELAMQNMKKVSNTAKCEHPIRRCLDISEMTTEEKNYWPKCALVHKCGFDSGCCEEPGHTCSPIESKSVDLYFFSNEHNNQNQSKQVERFTFENHTRCGCLHVPKNFLSRSKFSDCACPKDFFVSTSSRCECDCEKSNKKCKKIKRGKRSYPQKGCKGICSPPKCDYGEFKKSFGRCPRKNKEESE